MISNINIYAILLSEPPMVCYANFDRWMINVALMGTHSASYSIKEKDGISSLSKSESLVCLYVLIVCFLEPITIFLIVCGWTKIVHLYLKRKFYPFWRFTYLMSQLIICRKIAPSYGNHDRLWIIMAIISIDIPSWSSNTD